MPTRSRAPHTPRNRRTRSARCSTCSVATLAEQLFPGQGERLGVLWRDKQIEYTRLVTTSGVQGEHYRPFWEYDPRRPALRGAATGSGLGRCGQETG